MCPGGHIPYADEYGTDDTATETTYSTNSNSGSPSRSLFFVLSPPTAHVIASARAPSHIAPALTRAAASGPTPAAAPSPPPPTLLLLLLLLLLLVLPLPLLLLLLLSVIIMVTTMTVVHRMLARRHRRRRPALLFLWRLLLVAAHGRVRHRRRVVPGRVVGRLGTHPGLVVVPVLDV